MIRDNNDNLNRYPDPAQFEVREKLSKYLNVDLKQIFIGVGSDEIIDLLIRIFCNPQKDSVLIPIPTYGMYKVACDINNVKSIFVPLTKSFQIDVDATLSAITKNTKMIFLCSPNNPTGNKLYKKRVLEIVKNFNGIVVLDEAYLDFAKSDNYEKEIKRYKNLVLLRTFSKAWGLAGARCGYSVADEYITNILFKVKAPYNLNKLTSNAIVKAIGNNKKKNEF